MIDRSAYQQTVAVARSSAAGSTKTPSEAARLLSCSNDAIAGLLKLGDLQTRITPAGLRVTQESIATFSREYISLSSIARVEQTNSRALMHPLPRPRHLDVAGANPQAAATILYSKNGSRETHEVRLRCCRLLMTLQTAIWFTRSRAAACGRADPKHSENSNEVEIIRSL